MAARSRRSLASALALAAVALARDAASQTTAQVAQSLFDEARTLLESGRYAEACPKLAESQRLDPGGGTLLNLAVCHELEGRTASAWLEFRDALGQAIQDRREDRVALAQARIDNLTPKLMKVVVRVPSELASRQPTIELDRADLPRAAWSTPVPVDPGDHQITVTLGAARSESRVVAETPGAVYEIDVRDPSLAAAAAPPLERPAEQRRSTAFWIVLGGAGALLATSAITGIAALDADAYVHDNCTAARDFCRVADADDAASRARLFAWVSTATLAGGIGAAVVALFLPRETARTRTMVGVAPNGLGATLRFSAF